VGLNRRARSLIGHEAKSPTFILLIEYSRFFGAMVESHHFIFSMLTVPTFLQVIMTGDIKSQSNEYLLNAVLTMTKVMICLVVHCWLILLFPRVCFHPACPISSASSLVPDLLFLTQLLKRFRVASEIFQSRVKDPSTAFMEVSRLRFCP
jgi:hypothetical protein